MQFTFVDWFLKILLLKMIWRPLRRRIWRKLRFSTMLLMKSGGFYKCPVEKSVRSLMNVPFTLKTFELEVGFIKQAASQGMVLLKGDRSVGGVRA
ncbi:hypothetical protein AMTRI_Chr07g77850 [Amborella trichopoda]